MLAAFGRFVTYATAILLGRCIAFAGKLGTIILNGFLWSVSIALHAAETIRLMISKILDSLV